MYSSYTQREAQHNSWGTNNVLFFFNKCTWTYTSKKKSFNLQRDHLRKLWTFNRAAEHCQSLPSALAPGLASHSFRGFCWQQNFMLWEFSVLNRIEEKLVNKMENNIFSGLGEVGFRGCCFCFGLISFGLVWFLMRDKAFFFFLLTWIVKYIDSS